MEHRYARRRPASLNVSLVGRRLVRQAVSVLDISLDGLCVAVPTGTLTPGTLVDVHLPADPAGWRPGACLEAFVVHVSEHGTGLMFCAPASEERRQLLAGILGEPG